nr:hypothetical protein 6 [bacterium]
MTGNQCMICKHYWLMQECEAFPEGIPEEILTNEFLHTKPHPEDQNIRFKEIK